MARRRPSPKVCSTASSTRTSCRRGSGRRNEPPGWRSGAGRKACVCLTGGGRERVALVTLSGSIVRGRSRRLPFRCPSSEGSRPGRVRRRGAAGGGEGRRVGRIVLLDSPGGDALASDLIWREVERISARKPVVVLMGNAAASGGYYVSAAASHVVARRAHGFHRRTGHPSRRSRTLREAYQPRRT